MGEASQDIVCGNCGYSAIRAQLPGKLCPNCTQPLAKQRKGPQRAGDAPLVKQLVRELRPTPIKTRLIEAAAARIERPDDPLSILYQHTVFCQTSLPYRDPGEARTWERTNGSVQLEVIAGKAMHPEKCRFVPIGLPFGPKARMVLMHINQQAIISRSPEIEVQDTLTKFVRRTLKMDSGGRTIRTVKDQLTRLAASSIRLGVVKDGQALTVNSQIVTAFNLWFPKDDRQRVLWPSTVKLSLDYWESLKSHAVPLDESAIAALSHSGLALDIYAWLAQRLHRIPFGKQAFIAWAVLHAQFGPDYGRVRDFRAAFLKALRQVKSQYQGARFDSDSRGLTLWNSPPPIAVAPRLISGKN